jgi:hypothetical protein
MGLAIYKAVKPRKHENRESLLMTTIFTKINQEWKAFVGILYAQTKLPRARYEVFMAMQILV